jgi:hypothetical protein
MKKLSSVTEIVASIAAEICAATRRFPTSDVEPKMFPGFRVSDRFKKEFKDALETFEAKGNDAALIDELQRLDRGVRNMQRGFLRGSQGFFENQMDRRLAEFDMVLEPEFGKRFRKALEALAEHIRPQTSFDLDVAGELYRKVQQLAIELPFEQDSLERARKAKELAKAAAKAEKDRLADEARRQAQREQELARRKRLTDSIREQIGLDSRDAVTEIAGDQGVEVVH